MSNPGKAALISERFNDKKQMEEMSELDQGRWERKIVINEDVKQ